MFVLEKEIRNVRMHLMQATRKSNLKELKRCIVKYEDMGRGGAPEMYSAKQLAVGLQVKLGMSNVS